MFKYTIAILTVFMSIQQGHAWHRTSLIYHNDSRTDASWRWHLMQVSENGEFTGRWIFDAAIFTLNTDWMYYGKNLTGSKVEEVLQKTIADSKHLDSAISNLSESFGSPQVPIQVSIGVPYFNNEIESIMLNGQSYNLTKPEERKAAIKYYVTEVKSRALVSGWISLILYGVYYHREDLLTHEDDINTILYLNQEVHTLSMKSVWIPYYDAPSAWSGKNLGFDIVIVQPRYTFLSAIDSGDVRADRLYSTGFKSANIKQSFEYELRGRGETQSENWLAHQNLVAAQETGADAYPQAFFVGQNYDLFDQVQTQASAVGDSWWAYYDLTKYLLGLEIWKYEIPLTWNPLPESSPNKLKQVWILDNPESDITSIRLEFNDERHWAPWRGQISVMFNDDNHWVYASRLGSDEINPAFNSISVPLPVSVVLQRIPIKNISIELTREKNTPWPNVLRIVAGRYEPPFIANPIYEDVSLTSRPLESYYFSDSKNTHLDFDTGKLTDGYTSPGGEWWGNRSMGWGMINARFSIAITLRNIYTISTVRLITYSDSAAGIHWPTNIAALLSTSCVPQGVGLRDEGQSCVPSATSGSASLTSHSYPGSVNEKGVISLPIDDESARFVTVTGLCFAWCLFDEIQVINSDGNVISTGKPYRVTPQPGAQERNTSNPYTDNSRLLVDGNIATQFMHGGTWIDGIQGVNGTAETRWLVPRSARGIVIWLIPAIPEYGIILPDYISMIWRNEDGEWEPAVNVIPQTVGCGPSPCAKLDLPANSKITGIRGTFPNASTTSWYMISEISIY